MNLFDVTIKKRVTVNQYGISAEHEGMEAANILWPGIADWLMNTDNTGEPVSHGSIGFPPFIAVLETPEVDDDFNFYYTFRAAFHSEEAAILFKMRWS